MARCSPGGPGRPWICMLVSSIWRCVRRAGGGVRVSAGRGPGSGRRSRRILRSVTSRNGLLPGAAADVGGVGGPVAGGQALPGDGDAGADAEGAGEDGGGDLGGELEQRGAAGLAGAVPRAGESVVGVLAPRSGCRLALSG